MRNPAAARTAAPRDIAPGSGLATGGGGLIWIHRVHWLVVENDVDVATVAVEAACNRAAVGTDVADLDIVALADRSWQHERALHVVDRVAGRAPKLEAFEVF